MRSQLLARDLTTVLLDSFVCAIGINACEEIVHLAIVHISACMRGSVIVCARELFAITKFEFIVVVNSDWGTQVRFCVAVREFHFS